MIKSGESILAEVKRISCCDQPWGPERPGYNWVIPPKAPTLNSFLDNPMLGDERKFVLVDVSEIDNPASGFSKNEQVQEGQELVFHVYIHNNAFANQKIDGSGIAKSVKLRVLPPQPLHPNHKNILKAVLSSENTEPQVIWDSCTITTDATLRLVYIPGSAVLHIPGKKIVKKIDDTGILSFEGIAINALNDGYPAGEEYAGYLTFKMRAERFFLTEERDINNCTTLIYNDGTIYLGDYKDGYQNGYGTTLMPDGSIYEGQYVAGWRQGKGIMLFPSGVKYEGEWAKGKYNGTGRLTKGSRILYYGEFKDNKKQGSGESYNSDGTVYIGQFADDKREGEGDFYWPNGMRYHGQWHDNRQNGIGTMQYSSLSSYVGEWLNGKRHGQGKYYYENESVYDGSWVNDKQEGFAVFTFANGNRYEGNYTAGKRNGTGTLYFANGETYVGEWVNDCREGRGVQTYSDGSIYEGTWERDERNGYGVLRSKEGGVLYAGEWKDDSALISLSERVEVIEQAIREAPAEWKEGAIYFAQDIPSNIFQKIDFADGLSAGDVVALYSPSLSAWKIKGIVFTKERLYCNQFKGKKGIRYVDIVSSFRNDDDVRVKHKYDEISLINFGQDNKAISVTITRITKAVKELDEELRRVNKLFKWVDE